jgi:cell division septal protein FtsQ
MTIGKSVKPVAREGQLRQKPRQSASTRPDSSTNTSSRKVTPVSTRKGAREGVSAQTRRKVVYKVNANGVETRLPALPFLRFSWQWISGILAILLFLLVIFMVNSPMFRVRELTVSGLTRYTSKEFQPLVKNQKTSIFLFNTDAVMHSLRLVYPELINPQISISMPNQVLVSATERQPIILWQTGGKSYWIDAEGVVMDKRGDLPGLLTVTSSVNPPMARINNKPSSVIDYARMIIERQTGNPTTEELVNYVSPDALQAIITMSTILPEGGSLVYDPISGMGWRDPGGWEVYFGTDLSNMNFKQVEYQTILARIFEMGSTPVMISVEHVDAPYIRVE